MQPDSKGMTINSGNTTPSHEKLEENISKIRGMASLRKRRPESRIPQRIPSREEVLRPKPLLGRASGGKRAVKRQERLLSTIPPCLAPADDKYSSQLA